MNMKPSMKVMIVILTLTLIALPVEAAPGGNGNGNGNANGNGNENGNENANGNQNNNGHQNQANNNHSENKGRTQQIQEAIAKQARRNEVQRNRDARNIRDHQPAVNHNSDGNNRSKTNTAKSENGKWWKHPFDTRGQGNNGTPRMLNPYGFDKDSDRKELYGNNGRPIKEKEDVPEEPAPADPLPVEEPLADETLPEEILPEETLDLASLLSIDFSALGDENEAWMESWFDSVIASYSTYSTTSWVTTTYTYDQWYRMWYDHFFPEGRDNDTSTGIRLGGTRDDLDFTISGEWGSEPLQVTTTLVAAEDYSGYQYIYDPVTGTYTRQYITVAAGDVMQESSQEVVLDSATDSISLSTDVDESAFNFYFGESFSVDFSVTITDTTTGSSTTSTYDSSLFLFRCPYGKVYNKETNRPIVNAKITVYFEDGSIVPLDKALNPTATNPQYSDATGRYGAKLQTGRKYYIEVIAEGYEKYRSEIFTEKWHVLREDIPLTSLTAKAKASVPEIPAAGGALLEHSEPLQSIEAPLALMPSGK